MSQAPGHGELRMLLAQGTTVSSRAEERERRARQRTVVGLIVALVMIYTYDFVILVAGLLR
jgi:hypothetical protein